MIKGVGLISADLTAQNQFTGDEINIVQSGVGTLGIRIKSLFNLSISGVWVGRLTLQRSFSNGAVWLDISQYTSNLQTWDQEIESGVLYRIGFKTGDYTSGTASVRISK